MTDQPQPFNGLPKRPRFNPAFVPVVVDQNEIHFRAGPWSGPMYDMKDEDGGDELARLVDLVDGTRHIDEILAAFDQDDRSEIARVVRHLTDKRVICDVKQREDRRTVHTGYLSLRDHFTAESFEALETATALVLTDGPIGEFVASDLLDAGVSTVSYVPLGDEKVPRRLSGHDDLRPSSLDDLEADVADSDLVVFGTESPKPKVREQLNEVAYEANTPWIAGTVRGLDGVVGPTVIPGETACYACFVRRRNATIPDPRIYERYERTDRGDDRAAALGTPFGRIVAGHVAIDALNQLTGGFGFTAGRIIHYDFVDHSAEANDVLRMPRCPVCGSSENEIDGTRHLSLERLVDETNEEHGYER